MIQWNVVLNWNTTDELAINYNSFSTLLPLLNCFETPAVQLWAIWTTHYFCAQNREQLEY